MKGSSYEAANSQCSVRREATDKRSEEKTLSIFQPDTLLAAEYVEERRGELALAPEKRLMLAILKDAILTFQDNHAARYGKKKILLEHANEWLFKASDDGVFSFENICHAFEFKPEYIRKGLTQWNERELAKHVLPHWQIRRSPQN